MYLEDTQQIIDDGNNFVWGRQYASVPVWHGNLEGQELSN